MKNMKYSMEWIRQKFDAGDTIKYIFFWGHTPKEKEDVGNFIFSQWYDSPFVAEDAVYRTAEHWMMAQKAIVFGDQEIAGKVISAIKPGEVKELGRQIRNFYEPLWNEHKYEIVKAGNYHKFSQHRNLRDYLLQTGDRVLVEASPVDSIWGIGLSADAKQINNPHTWRGTNLLGFALMEVRDQIRIELGIPV